MKFFDWMFRRKAETVKPGPSIDELRTMLREREALKTTLSQNQVQSRRRAQAVRRQDGAAYVGDSHVYPTAIHYYDAGPSVTSAPCSAPSDGGGSWGGDGGGCDGGGGGGGD